MKLIYIASPLRGNHEKYQVNEVLKKVQSNEKLDDEEQADDEELSL